MKSKLLIACFLLLGAVSAKAQTSNAILFTENGERFQVVLNGILQNAKPETNVKMTGLPAPNYKCRILFEDKALGYLDFNMFFPEPPQEVTWNIKKNKKGEFVTRAVSWIPIAEAPPTQPTQTIVVYTTTPPPPVAVTSTTVQQTTTTTSGSSNPNGMNMNMGINVNENGGGINMNVSGMDGGNTTSSTTTTTTHSTTVTSTSSGTVPVHGGEVHDVPPPTQVIYVTGYNGPIGCPVPMNSGDFSSFKSSVQSKSFEESKLTIAKQVLDNNCLTSAQVREVMKLFSFEDTRLNFAKYAYGHTYDTGNYYKVNDAFTFESSIEELNDYIKGH